MLEFHEHSMKSSLSTNSCSICHANRDTIGFECKICSFKICANCIDFIRRDIIKLKHQHNIYIKTENMEKFKCNNCGELKSTWHYFYCKVCKYYKCPIC